MMRNWSRYIPSSRIITAMAVAVALRWAAAFVSTGFDHPNEFYRLLEPIASWNGYSGRLPWEWTDGVISKIPMVIVQKLILAMQWFGVTTPESQLIILRMIYGTLSLSTVLAAWRMMLWSGGSRRLAMAAALWIAVWPEFIYRSVRLMDYSVEASLSAIAIILVLHLKKNTRWIVLRAGLAGAILGLLFFFRNQTGLHLISLSLIIFTLKDKKWKRLAMLVGCYGLVIAGLAYYEADGKWNDLLLPFRKYWIFNIVDDRAVKDYGADPWHRYITDAAKMYGFLPFVALILLSLWKSSEKRIVLLFALPFLVTSMISHKEARYILGFVWLLVPAGLSALRKIQARTAVIATVLVCFVIGFFIQGERVLDHVRLHAADVSDWSEMGRRIADLSKARPGLSRVPTVVWDDPDFVPGAFFLKHKGPVCFVWGDKSAGTCPEKLRSMIRFELRRGSEENKSATLIGGWLFSLIEPEGAVLPVVVPDPVVAKVPQSSRPVAGPSPFELPKQILGIASPLPSQRPSASPSTEPSGVPSAEPSSEPSPEPSLASPEPYSDPSPDVSGSPDSVADDENTVTPEASNPPATPEEPE